MEAKRTRKGGDKVADASSETGVDLTSSGNSESPAMPHERDQSAGMTGGVPSKRVQQGHADVKRGVKDTSRATEADNAYEKLKK